MDDNRDSIIPNRAQDTTESFKDNTVVPGTNHQNAEDHWVLPAYVNPFDVLGQRNKSRINEIQKATGSFIEFNEQYNQVDIWGDAEAIAKAKSYLDMIVSRLLDKESRTRRKTKKWSKPERELTEKEKRRAERRQARIDEEKRYHGLPPILQNYNAVFPLPDQTLPLLRLMGENESYFNRIRADCKCYIWYEPSTNSVRFAADTEESVKQAAQRVRNWHLRHSRKVKKAVLRLMQQPTQQWLLTYRKLPNNFTTYRYVDPTGEQNMLERQRMLETVNTGVIPKINDLIVFNEEATRSEQLSERVKTLNSRNEKMIEHLLVQGLESLRLNDWVIRMKIRYGQICLIDYPKKDGQFLSIEEVSDKIFHKPQFKSALAPCISRTQQGLKGLFEYLSEDQHAVAFSENPRTSFVIMADQYPFAAPPTLPGQRDPPRGDMWPTVMQISFTENGQRGLWSTITECTDVVDITTTDLESHYSWDLKLQSAQILSNEDIDSPHEKFAHGLRVSPTSRLIMVTSNDYVPRLVTQKTKWLYSWKEGYIVEICQDEIWDIGRIERPDRELPVDLTLFDPHRVLFKVSLYKESWVDRFAENLNLKIGEAPSWTIKDFLATQEENASSLMKIAKEFSNILNSTVPLYWENSGNSLV
ncbi:uncharacterized protein BX663DRAFT_436641 [Cokeromyces recurvatus]|uniref:uncharacterized protein n=1 Tax=Cokeromyces recurvatus TaxID=90255 RepID=UPI0022207E23|nr:uncharacterized protein BX663DRAFT_436641 [Cokeromyces recurvatus]KAI7901909.1 hypothetical protein BX663DRAFT_436641 [Cokeromyces recurvatus]